VIVTVCFECAGSGDISLQVNDQVDDVRVYSSGGAITCGIARTVAADVNLKGCTVSIDPQLNFKTKTTSPVEGIKGKLPGSLSQVAVDQGQDAGDKGTSLQLDAGLAGSVLLLERSWIDLLKR
jgi:hypothetical protein